MRSHVKVVALAAITLFGVVHIGQHQLLWQIDQRKQHVLQRRGQQIEIRGDRESNRTNIDPCTLLGCQPDGGGCPVDPCRQSDWKP